jgi:hypothetical protein
MIFFLSFIFILFLFLIVAFFLSTRILINTTKQDSYNSHYFELGLIFNTLRFQFVYREKEKFIQFILGKWKIFSKSLIEKKPIKVKGKKIKPQRKELFGQKMKSYFKNKSLRLFEIKDHLVAMIKSFKNPKISGEVQIGFNNPMHTGLLMGSYSLLSGIWTSFRKNVVLEPVFTNNTANWQLAFSTQIILAGLAWRGLLIWNTFRKTK